MNAYEIRVLYGDAQFVRALERYDIARLRQMGSRLGVTGRSRTELIAKIARFVEQESYSRSLARVPGAKRKGR